MDASRWLSWVFCLGLTFGCAVPTPPSADNKPVVTGTVASSDGFALAAGSQVEVTLADVSRADAPAVVLAQETLPISGPYQLPFSLPYTLADIEPNHTYVVSARVTDKAGQLRYLNLQSFPVLTHGALSHVVVVVDPVQRP